jgi:hypothetical protein
VAEEAQILNNVCKLANYVIFGSPWQYCKLAASYAARRPKMKGMYFDSIYSVIQTATLMPSSILIARAQLIRE